MVTEIETLVSEVLGKLDEILISKLKEWGKIVQLFIDGSPYYINFQEDLKLRNGKSDSADFSITSSILTFNGIISGIINPVEAVVSGDVAIDGSLTVALEFSEMIQNSSLTS